MELDRRLTGLVLTPGAGADRNHHTLVAIEQILAPMPVARIDFPYRTAGRRVPDRAPVAVAFIESAVATFAGSLGVASPQIVIGGRSYGGRMCSLAVAGGLPTAGLVLLSYPLHSPGKSNQGRAEHFRQLRCPVLFVSGDRDPFASPAQLAAAAAAIPGPVTIEQVTGAHDPKDQDGQIADLVANWIHSLAA